MFLNIETFIIFAKNLQDDGKTNRSCFLTQAEIFIDEIEVPARRKFFVVIRKTKSRIFGDWFKKMTATKDLFEFCVSNNGKYYRLFCFWDSQNGNQTLIVCTHGLVKKTNKTPKSEIIKAEDIKNNYFKEII